MFGTFLNTLSGFFDRRFFIVHWGPAFIGLGLIIGLTGLIIGTDTVFTWWDARTATEQIMFGGATLLAVTLLAYLLESLTVPLVRLYEGYTSPKGPLSRRFYGSQKKALEKLDAELSTARTAGKQRDFTHAYHLRHHYFPRNAALLRPTQLGNVLVAAEEYAHQIYYLDAAIWWPRLASLLPETFRIQIDTALAPMLALLNLCTWLTLLALGGGLAVLLTNQNWWLFIAVFFGLLFLARVCYLAAVSQAMNYGLLIRVAFDLYRHEILKQMNIPIPDHPVEERKLWDKLNAWHYYYTPPWKDKAVDEAETNVTERLRDVFKQFLITLLKKLKALLES